MRNLIILANKDSGADIICNAGWMILVLESFASSICVIQLYPQACLVSGQSVFIGYNCCFQGGLSKLSKVLEVGNEELRHLAIKVFAEICKGSAVRVI